MGSEQDVGPPRKTLWASLAKIELWWHGQSLYQGEPQRVFLSASSGSKRTITATTQCLLSSERKLYFDPLGDAFGCS